MTVDGVPGDRLTRGVSRVLWLTVLLVVAATPLIVDPRGRDLFRVPKTAFFQTGMLVAGALAAAAALLSDAFAAMLVRNRRSVILACAAVAWVAVVSMTSTVPAVSRAAPFSIFCYALLFVITVAVARSGSVLTALAALLVPAVVNAVIVLMQAFDVWQPLGISVEGSDRFGNIALIGNPNTAGTYLLVPTIAAFSAAATLRRYRVLFGAITLVLLAGLFEAQTITVLFGLAAALVAFVATGSKRIRLLAIAVVMGGILGVLLYAPTRQRLMSLKEPLMKRDFRAVTSGRLPAAGVALQMFRDRPLLGLGPGVFAARYMAYRLAIEESHPEWIQPARENFGEAHNDHLQLLAETGIPGYALFVFVLVQIAWLTLRRSRSVRGAWPQPASPGGGGLKPRPTYGSPGDERGRFVRLFALPAAVGFGAVALGQFPLELTAVSATSLFAAALCFSWSDDAPG